MTAVATAAAIGGLDERERNRSLLVLAVDDAVENLNLLKAIVTKAGYAFLAASSGAACMHLVNRVRPRLILLDVKMKGMDGYETCQRLRAIPTLDDVPIVFVTSQGQAQDIQAGMAVGGNDYLVKPIGNVRLLDRVRHWTSRRATRPRLKQPAQNRTTLWPDQSEPPAGGIFTAD